MLLRPRSVAVKIVANQGLADVERLAARFAAMSFRGENPSANVRTFRRFLIFRAGSEGGFDELMNRNVVFVDKIVVFAPFWLHVGVLVPI